MLDRILARFGYTRTVWAVPSGHRDLDAVVRADRWVQFYNEPGGLGDMIQGIRREYFEQVGGLRAGDADGMRALAMADLIARKLDGTVKLIIETGDMERQSRQHAAQIAALPEAMRRRL
jgi:hypothetical protein